MCEISSKSEVVNFFLFRSFERVQNFRYINVIDLFLIFVTSRSTESLIVLNFWLGMYT